MSSNVFRSHLMQHFAAAARNQARPPLALANYHSDSRSSLEDEPSSSIPRSASSLQTPLPPHSPTPPPATTPPMSASTSSFSPSNSALEFQSIICSRRTTSKFMTLSTNVPTNSSTSWNYHSKDFVIQAITRAVQCGTRAPNHHRTEPTTFLRMISPSDATNALTDILYHVTYRRQLNLLQAHQHKQQPQMTRDENQTKEKNLLTFQEEAEKHAIDKRDKWRTTIAAYIVVSVRGQPCQDDYSGNIDLHTIQDEKDTHKVDDFLYGLLPYYPPQSERQLEDYAAACASIQNILLSLHSEGLGAKWATPSNLLRCRAFRNLIHCKSDDFIVGLIMVGFPQPSERKLHQDQQSRIKTKRDLLGDVLRDL